MQGNVGHDCHATPATPLDGRVASNPFWYFRGGLRSSNEVHIHFPKLWQVFVFSSYLSVVSIWAGALAALRVRKDVDFSVAIIKEIHFCVRKGVGNSK
jgi:hypothetical protein